MERNSSLEELQEAESRPSIYGNPKYLTKYVNFYDRLDHEVSKKMFKDKFYGSLTNLKSLNQSNFTPNIEKSRKSHKMESSLKPNYTTLKNLNRSMEEESLNR